MNVIQTVFDFFRTPPAILPPVITGETVMGCQTVEVSNVGRIGSNNTLFDPEGRRIGPYTRRRDAVRAARRRGFTVA